MNRDVCEHFVPNELFCSKCNNGSHPVFSIGAGTRGRYQGAFVFRDKKELLLFKKTTLKYLESKYGKLVLVVHKLPSLKIGDYCHCLGEGADVLKIENIRQIEAFRWSFLLSNGCWENVYKCHEKVKA